MVTIQIVNATQPRTMQLTFSSKKPPSWTDFKSLGLSGISNGWGEFESMSRLEQGRPFSDTSICQYFPLKTGPLGRR